jgi:hypothetical protein
MKNEEGESEERGRKTDTKEKVKEKAKKIHQLI